MNDRKAGLSAVILLHEIYGVNGHMHFYENRFSEMGFHVLCPNLLETDQSFSYTEEQQAYQNFISHVGFEKAARQVSALIQECEKHYDHIFLVGFSVGATVAWLCSKEKGVTGIIGYYGSRIRDYTSLAPSCPALLIFAKHEKSFDVAKVANQLSAHNATCLIFDAKHGFSDPYSDAYNKNLSEETFAKATSFFNKHRKNTSMDC